MLENQIGEQSAAKTLSLNDMGKVQRLSKAIRRLKGRMKIRYFIIHEASRVGLYFYIKKLISF